MPSGFSGGDTAFVLISAALVMLMTPGLAFFYGGMVRVKSALNMLAMSFIALGIVTVLWVLFGFSIAFGPDSFHGLIGDFSMLLILRSANTQVFVVRNWNCSMNFG